MRKIETHDVFKMARIIKEAGIRKEISDVISEAQARITKEKRTAQEKDPDHEKVASKENGENTENNGDFQEKIGVEIFFVIAEACSSEKLEKMLYDFMGGIAEKDAEDIKHTPLDEMVGMFKEMANTNNIFNFFNAAGRLVQK